MRCAGNWQSFHPVKTEVSMFYPQGNFYSQGNLGYPHGGFGYPQGGFGYPQVGFGQQSSQATPNTVPFANTLYGYPQLTPYFPQLTPYFAQSFAQTPPHVSNWQHLAQQLAAQSLALQHPPGISGLNGIANGQHLAQQLAAQSLALQHPPGISGLNGIANGAGQSVGVWQQANPEQINPAVLQQPQHQLQRLAQYHYLVAQQFAQLAAQQAAQNAGNPYAGQFIPGTGQFVPNQLGANFVPGITMH
jgi:hypothetical protein